MNLFERDETYFQDYPQTRQGMRDAVFDHTPFVVGTVVREKKNEFRAVVNIRTRWWTRFVPFLDRYIQNKAQSILDAICPLGVRVHAKVRKKWSEF